MKKWLVIAFAFFAVQLNAAASSNENKAPTLNRVILQISAEDWAKTSSADVTIDVNATLTDAGLAKARQQILEKLQRIAKGTWHITAFNRSQDNSGLEKLYVRAESRLAEQQLSKLRSNADSVSKAGEKYTIANIAFKPELSEVEASRDAVREKIYSQLNAELKRLNAAYPDQHYFVHTINFVSQQIEPPRFKMAQTALVASPQPIQVSDKIRMTALVVLAAK